jgi:AAT family amino acid transporter
VACFILSLIYWPIWGWISKSIILAFGTPGLQEVDAKTAGKFFQVFAEATFFWMIINALIWQALIFGGYGTYFITSRQPWAGIWYTAVDLIVGVIGFRSSSG